VLSPLQQRVAHILTALPEADDFVLAGGGALIACGEIDRPTRDLDYFATDPDAVDRLLPALERALRAEGIDVNRVLVNRGFARLEVGVGQDRTEVDLAHDYRLLPVEQSPLGPTLAAEELATDKLLALFDRAEAREAQGPPNRRNLATVWLALPPSGSEGRRL
jgi:hypothetical protein